MAGVELDSLECRDELLERLADTHDRLGELRSVLLIERDAGGGMRLKFAEDGPIALRTVSGAILRDNSGNRERTGKGPFRTSQARAHPFVQLP